MIRTLLALLVVSAACLSADATLGFDLSYFQGQVSQSSFDCLADSGYEFGIIQATAGTGGYNPYVASDISRGKSAGICCLDVYIFPDTSQSASSSMTTLINNLLDDGALTNNMVWMDIEGTQYWSSSCSSNQSWLSEAISTIESMYNGCGQSTCVGIYSSASQWDPIMCDTTEFSNYQLWWAYYDNDPSFSDFSPFGGWSSPNIKQYKGTTNVCSTSIDLDS